MNPTKQRIAIAESTGWTSVFESGSGQPGDESLIRGLHPVFDLGRTEIPDYPRDHNAMKEARHRLNPVQLREYGLVLHQILVDKMQAMGCKTQADYDKAARWVYDTTSEEQAEAYLKTLNLWVDSDE